MTLVSTVFIGDDSGFPCLPAIMESPLHIVFCGEIIEGFDAEEVRLSAKSRLNASLAQIEQLFSGRPAILKKGLDAKSGARYLALLAHIGMRARLEPETRELAPSVPPPAPAPAFDPERTQLVAVGDIARHVEELQRTRPAPPAAATPVAPAPVAPAPEAPVLAAPVAPAPATPAEAPAPQAPDIAPAAPSAPPVTVNARATPQRPSLPRLTPEALGPSTEPHTVFFTEATPTPAVRKKPARGGSWLERLFLALLIGGIAYTLYWVLTRY